MNSNMVKFEKFNYRKVYHFTVPLNVFLHVNLFTSTSAGGVLNHFLFMEIGEVKNIFNTVIFAIVSKFFALLCAKSFYFTLV